MSTPFLDDVAVLLPAFNAQHDVERTLASFCERAPVRVLIVDDGSLPPVVAPAAANMSIEVLRMARNSGIERALQAGMDALAARGIRYAARIDAGDLATPYRLEKQRAYMEAHPETAVLGMWTHVVDMQGAPLFDLRPPTEPADIRRAMLMRACFTHPSLMLRVDAVIEAGNYRAEYRAAEDLDLILRLMKHHDGANLPEFGVYYELNEHGISATKRRSQVWSTLRLQMKYLRVTNLPDWIGVAKNAAHLVLPYRALRALKTRLLGA
ncbi:glycosyl transferase family protein [Caballeronia sordidicola]|uniref:Glycosyl transferase family protein n=1 Tax=Caballeronia sordidicola TaxID=196367 RepID=A0A158IHY0_CABSO|nr:glycosyltransferase [Caballeronia sordidicola]SAL55620.1 glycosyl transferase family protein [Caballeronia sordidicola]